MHSVLKVHKVVTTMKIQAKALLSGLIIQVAFACQWFSSLLSSDGFYLRVRRVTFSSQKLRFFSFFFISSDLISFLVSSSVEQFFNP